jgi:CDP-6-deoxy-D-xylo-4-hexulose-3-dehydrase
MSSRRKPQEKLAAKKTENRARAVEHSMLAIEEENAEKVEKFIPGETTIPVSGKKLLPSDFELLIHASIDGWLTEGKYTDEFEKLLKNYVGVRNCSCFAETNS